MRLFGKFKKLTACAILVCFIPSQAWAQGINIPAGSTLNINTAQLTIPGNITNAGTLTASSGAINITGNWTNTGVFTSGTDTVNFNGASGTQYVNSGWSGSGTNNTFYNLTHSGASLVQLLTDPIDINGSFNNSNVGIGTFNTNNLNMTVSGNWDNLSATSFTPGTDSVTLNGGNQSVLGSTSFYRFFKTVPASGGPYTLTFDSSGTQNFSHMLSMQGNNIQDLDLRSNNNGTQAKIYLSLSGDQAIDYVDVKDSNAGTAGVQQTLLGRNASAASATQNNTNWDFNNATITWLGTHNTDWNNPFNWSLGVVPGPGDTVIIPTPGTAGSSSTNEPNLCPAGHVFSCATTAPYVTVGSMTIQSGASLTLNGIGLTVTSGTGTFTNMGTVYVQGNEPALSLTQDPTATDNGTFIYKGTGAGSNDTLLLTSYDNLVIDDTNASKDTFIAPSGTLTALGNVTVTSGTLDIEKDAATLDVGTLSNSGTLTVNGGVLTAFSSTPSTGNIVVDGSVNITSGTFTPPGSTGSFTLTGNFSNSAGVAAFISTAGKGTVALNGGNQSVNGATIFYNFSKIVSSGGPDTLTFDSTSGAIQEFTNNLTLEGYSNANNFLIRSNSSTAAKIALNNSATQTIDYVNVMDSDASGVAGFTQQILAFNSFNAGTNTNWLFEILSIIVPATGTTVGVTPTVIGTANAGSIVYIRDISNNVVATAKSDANNNFRVALGQDAANTGFTPFVTQLAAGANSLTPYLTTALTSPGSGTNFTVTASPPPTTTQVPNITGLNCPVANPICNNITNPNISQFITGSTPTISGQGAANQTVTVQAFDASNNLLLTAGSGTVAGNGTYSVKLSTALPAATNVLSVTVSGTASALLKVSLTDPFGYVYNSSTNQAIQNATVTLYDATTKKVAADAGLKSCNLAGTCCDMSGTCTDSSGNVTTGNPPGNPFTTGPDGFYSFLAPPNQYYINVSAMGYTYPSVVTTVPAGRSVVTGSKGQTFTVGSTIFQLDLPVDATSMLLRITKNANKSDASVGDIVMYTVNIQNLSSTDAVNNVYLNDEIPPGFKYIKDRVLLNGTPIGEPNGQRPLLFNIGTVAAATTVVLQYQLVIGSGVTMGNYRNTAEAQFATGVVISNPAQASVRIIPDPVFDLGSVIGKVFFDWNENGIQDPPYFDPVSHETIIEKPVPNVQIVMEDGTVITADRDGKFNIPGLLPGRHLFRLDERTLPPGAYMTTDKTVIVDVTAGSISKVNFGVNIDETETKGRDAVFFNEKIRLTQGRDRPVPRLNAALFNASANAKSGTEEVVLYEGALVRQAEFRIFTNYWPFISSWRLDIMDADTKKVIKSFEGTPLNINDPIYWNGRDDQDIIINPDHKYSYVFSVADNKNNRDDTKENLITVREIKDEASLKKERDETKDVLKDRADRYRKWLDTEAALNNLNHQLIQVQGETIDLDRQGTDVKSIHIMKGNNLFTDLPLTEQYGLTPDELMAGGFSTADEKDNLEIILPNGDYSLDVVSAKAPDASSSNKQPVAVPQPVPAAGGMPSRGMPTSPGMLEHYSRPLKVGDDYMMFVALGDAQVGYNIDRGNIEPIQDPTQEPGFYKEGKGAYYLKGQILGKYLITSSFDSDRAEKALFRQLDPNTYYPVYGDGSSINYDAADTQGALYLKVEWDKSSAILGNYAVDFNDTEFASFSRAYYGGKIDYQSVASNPYGDARTKLVVYHAQVQQQPSHNEFLATGGSLYFLKYQNVIQGSDVVTIQVRDQTTGLVVASQTMTNGADYELDNGQGRILFWQPVAMIAQSENIITNNLINGDPIYVVVDYQYAVSGMQTQGAQGARVAQSVGDNVVLGGTYVQDDSSGQNYTLEGTDATLHVNKDSTVKAEYAQTTSQETGSYVSTDGGISFTPLMLDSTVSGKAYGIKGDTRLFDNVGLKTYYKWIGNNFGATDTTSQQGTEKMGMSMTFDMTPVTRLTASEDIQRLLAQDNLQVSTQVGASETDTTMIQIVHTAEKLKLTGQFQLIQTKNVINGVESSTNQQGATLGGQAQYDLTNRIKLTLGQQVDVQNPSNTATTLGAAARVTDQTTLNAQEVLSSQGKALTAGVTNQIGKRIALTTAYTLTNLNTGEVDKTASVGVTDQLNKNITATGNVALTGSSLGTNTATASVGAIAKISNSATVNMSVGKSQSATGAQGASNINLNGTTQIGNTTVTGTATANGGITTTSNPLAANSTGLLSTSNPLSIGTTGVTAMSSVGVQATTKVNDDTSTNGSINVANDDTGSKTTTFGFGNTSKLDQELQAVTSNSFSFSPGAITTDSSKYGLVRNQNGKNLEADLTQQTANQPGTISESNIYGLSGDVNDRLAVTGSVQRGKVQNLGTSQSTITDFSFGSGYVLKDTETAVERLKNSLKLELRVDRGIGTDSLRQYVLYDALDSKITDNYSVNAKIDYSKTLDTTTGAVAERHQEIILGTAYRPVNFDNLNLIAEYSYQDGYGGGLQQADALNTNVQQTVAQVLSAEGVYDINDKWQLAEKLAYRIENEQDTGFQFTQTHTWLMIHRLNYKIDKDWTISGEYRDLAQVEAKDNKQGLLLEATRDINANTQLAIGWNFTKYSDDLTDLSYTSLGPFIRMTGKFYDETPEERARARAKWLDARISEWAWILIRKELSKKDSKIVIELNRMFALAKVSQKAGQLEESRQIYKDIITAGQIMYDEAAEYIRGRVEFEEQLQKLDKTAREYFKGGEYVKARKIWEKVVEDASTGVVK